MLQSSAAGGYIIRNWHGQILNVGANHYGCTSMLMAEARALRDGVQTRVVAGYNDIIVEGDNQLLINAFLGKTSTPWQILNVLRDVKFL